MQQKREYLLPEKDQEKKNQKQKEKSKKTVARSCGYIVWKDRKVVVFYTNDLSDTPTKDFLHIAKETDSEEAIRCVGGLVDVERWDDECRNTCSLQQFQNMPVAQYGHLYEKLYRKILLQTYHSNENVSRC